MPTIQPIISTPDLDRQLAFYTGLLGAVEITRVPGDSGSTFFVGLQIGDSELGLVADKKATTDTVQRILISVDVKDVDGLLERVRELGGRAPNPANDMPWGQRVAHITDPDGNAMNLTQQIG